MVTYDYREGEKTKRTCYTCGVELFFDNLVYTFYMRYTEKTFDREMLTEIWKNEIFILECCLCHKIRTETTRILELIKNGL